MVMNLRYLLLAKHLVVGRARETGTLLLRARSRWSDALVVDRSPGRGLERRPSDAEC